MLNKIILASKSKVRKEILDKNNIPNRVVPSNVDEDIIKKNLIKKKATPDIISKNLAELKANKISLKHTDKMVLGADSVIDLDGELISKPENRNDALTILNKLNGKIHHLISSACISLNGSMIWNFTDKAKLTMKNFSEKDLELYLSKISDEKLYAYNVYQIEGDGKNLFSDINGDENTIIGYNAFSTLGSGSNNVAIGSNAMAGLQPQCKMCTAIGSECMTYTNTTAFLSNVAIGHESMGGNSISGAKNNVAIGNGALYNLTAVEATYKEDQVDEITETEYRGLELQASGNILYANLNLSLPSSEKRETS